MILSKNILLTLAGSISLGAGVTAISADIVKPDIKKPNIIYFLIDDMGWQDTSVPFWKEKTPLNHFFRTPSMERLAASGVKFTSAYACAVCSPSRVSLMTGMNASRHHVTNWTLQKNGGPDNGQRGIKLPQWNVNGISPLDEPVVERAIRAKCLPKFLQEAGYETIHVGKAHFGAIGTAAENPKSLGFDVNIGGHAAGGPGSYLGTQNFGNDLKTGKRKNDWSIPHLEAYHGKDIFLSEALTLEALKAVDSAVKRDKPFFLYMSHYAVHVPFAADKRFIKNYQKEGVSQTEAMYGTLVEGMDKSLGDLLDYLDKQNLRNNTMIVFMSDNGGLSNHARGGGKEIHNLPLSRGKGSIHEGGIRVPMIVSWPGKVPAGTSCDTAVIVEDGFPSLLEVAGIPASAIPESQRDGQSFIPLATGEITGDPTRQLVWHYPNSWTNSRTNGYGPYSAIRVGDWKYVFYHEPETEIREELFNIREDIGEKTNAVKTFPAKRDELAKQLDAYLKTHDAQMPTDLKTKEIISIPAAPIQ